MSAEAETQAHEDRSVERINLQLRIQHGLLMASVIVLILTGVALLYSDSWFGRFLIELEGGYEAPGIIHRVAAILLIATTIYHLLYVFFTREGHNEFMELLPRGRDFRDWIRMLAYDEGLRPESPKLGRYSYREKFQYWPIAFFTLIMILSGVVLWQFGELFGLLPKWAFDVAVHGGTGTLILVILTLWHLYIMHLAPGRFPMDWSFWHGRISMEQLRKEHPLEYERLHPGHHRQMEEARATGPGSGESAESHSEGEGSA